MSQPLHAASLLVIDTKCCAGLRDEAPGWEITLAVDPGPDAKPTVVRTQDERVYRRALAAEGTNARFDLTWHQRTRTNRQLCNELQTLMPALEEFTGRI